MTQWQQIQNLHLSSIFHDIMVSTVKIKSIIILKDPIRSMYTGNWKKKVLKQNMDKLLYEWITYEDEIDKQWKEPGFPDI